MVKCHVCGKDASAGWICGIPPAADSQKLGLCPEHDSVEQRAEVLEAWERLLQNRLEHMARGMRRSPSGAAPGYRVHVHYREGGVRSVDCTAYDVTQDKDLLLCTAGGGYEFFPLQHVKHFRVEELQSAPRAGDEAGTSTGPRALTGTGNALPGRAEPDKDTP
jgi:hypothetical protein